MKVSEPKMPLPALPPKLYQAIEIDADCYDEFTAYVQAYAAGIRAERDALQKALQEVSGMTGYVDCDVCTDVRVTADAALTTLEQQP